MKNISVADLKKTIKRQDKIINVYGLDLKIIQNITVDMRHQFAEALYNGIYSSDDDGVCMFRNYLIQPIERALFFMMFTNVSVDADNFDEMMDIAMNSDLIEKCFEQDDWAASYFTELFETSEAYCINKYNEMQSNDKDNIIPDMIQSLIDKFSGYDVETMYQYIDKLSQINKDNIIVKE